MIAPARIAAYEVVRAVSAGSADLPHALARARAALHDERDRALAGEIATGTIRWQGAFDRLISEFGRRPLSRFDPEVVDILRITLFQLLHLDRIPASAAVDDAVSLTKKVGKRSAAGVVNAIARRVSRERRDLPLPRRPAAGADRDSVLDYLSVTLSHPRWLAARRLDRHGFDATEAWMQFDNSPAPLTLRANRLRITAGALAAELMAQGVETRPGRFAPDALVVTRGNPLLTPLAESGLFVVQDEASQLVAVFADARPGEVVLDACASPGGKTTAMAAAMNGRGLIVATDLRGRRVDLLQRTVRAAGADNVRVVRADAATLPFGVRFDRVLLDAPCSGLGTIRRDPDVRWRRTAADLGPLAAAQLAMLRETARVLRPGGTLIYATCSSEPEENDEVVDSFLADGAFEPGQPERLAAHLIDTAGHLRTLPFRDGLEAFFAAILVKTKDLR